MRIAVIGTGLIGASVGLAARERGHDVAGYDPDERALADIRRLNSYTEVSPSTRGVPLRVALLRAMVPAFLDAPELGAAIRAPAPASATSPRAWDCTRT